MFFGTFSSNVALAAKLLRVLVAGIHIGDVGFHHVLDEFLEADLRDPSQLLLGLGAVTLE